MPRCPRRPVQLELPTPPTWGGRRDGAGRPRGARPRAWHRARGPLPARIPSYVTMRARAGLPSLRRRDLCAAIERAIGEAGARADCRVVHYSVQEDHLHLLLEAHDGRALSSGARGLAIRIARAVNRVLGRRGPVWDGRYDRHDLRTPREVRHCLRYVLNNALKHGHVLPGFDRCSSARWFDGWREAPRETPAGTPVVQPPRTWLMTTGWRRAGGPIGVHEVPGRGTRSVTFTFVEL